MTLLYTMCTNYSRNEPEARDGMLYRAVDDRPRSAGASVAVLQRGALSPVARAQSPVVESAHILTPRSIQRWLTTRRHRHERVESARLHSVPRRGALAGIEEW
eukprot:4269498-Prymnesium_polylepis.1